MPPEHLKYTSNHAWCLIEGDRATIGVTEFALSSLGELIYVDLPDVGDDVLVEIPFGEIEGVEDTFEICSPFDGVVLESNGTIAHRPDQLTKDPYGQNWLIRLKLDRPSQADVLLSAREYEQLARKKRR